MSQKIVMILEDDEVRIRGGEAAVKDMSEDFSLLLWRSAVQLIEDCGKAMPKPCLISLDHDLAPAPGADSDPGDGLQVAGFLGAIEPICPVIIHTSNTERRWSMHNEFRFGRWPVEIILPMGEDWIQKSWLPLAKSLIRR